MSAGRSFDDGYRSAVDVVRYDDSIARILASHLRDDLSACSCGWREWTGYRTRADADRDMHPFHVRGVIADYLEASYLETRIEGNPT